MKNIARYASDKDNVKRTHTDLTQMRKDILKKINLEEKERLEEQLEGELEEMDDQQFKKKLI